MNSNCGLKIWVEENSLGRLWKHYLLTFILLKFKQQKLSEMDRDGKALIILDLPQKNLSALNYFEEYPESTRNQPRPKLMMRVRKN